jgi:hypothetical protein
MADFDAITKVIADLRREHEHAAEQRRREQWRQELREAQARQSRRSMAITRLLIAGSRGEPFDPRDQREAGLAGTGGASHG